MGIFESLPISPLGSKQDITAGLNRDNTTEQKPHDLDSLKLDSDSGYKLNSPGKLKPNKPYNDDIDSTKTYSQIGSTLDSPYESKPNKPNNTFGSQLDNSDGTEPDSTMKSKPINSDISNLDCSGVFKANSAVRSMEEVLDTIEDIDVQCAVGKGEEQKDKDSKQPQLSNLPTYKYITLASDLESAIIEIKHKIRETSATIAVDIEGYKLSRAGSVTLLSVATSSDVYLFDVLKLGKTVFDKGLKSILEDKQIDKLMFDCRQDSDALWHLFDVKLEGILDVQLLEVISRPDESHALLFDTTRNKRANEIVRLEGLLACIYHYIKDNDIVRAKQQVAEKMEKLKIIWEERPLPDDLLVYAAIDVKTLFTLFDALKPDEEDLTRLRLASDLYSKTKRDMIMRRYNEYEQNPYLPLDVIPAKGRSSFEPGTTKCTGCLRLFPYDEFTKTQLSKNVQLCRVCKLVKSHKDRQCPHIPSRIGRVPAVLPTTERKPTNITNESRYSRMPNLQGNSLYDTRDSIYLRRDYDYYDDDSGPRENYSDHDDYDDYNYEDEYDFRSGYVYDCGLRECERGLDTGSGEWMYSYD